MFSMTEELNQLIFKYNLDKYYPQYRKKYKAEKILENVLHNTVNRREKTILVSNDKIVLDIVIRNRVFSNDYIDVQCISDIKDMDNIAWQNYANVYILSLKEAEKYGKWFRTHNINYNWIYDIFEIDGLIFEKEFYKLLDDYQGEWFVVPFFGKEMLRDNLLLELYFQKMKYEYSPDERVRTSALEKAFFIAIVMKNFVCAEKYLSSLGEMYLEFWNELQELLNKIKKEITKRKQKDIVWYWMDALSYEKSEGMSYLQDIMSKSVVFENAYTNTPYTNPTLRGIFCKKKQVDDKSYKISLVNEENSDLLKRLLSKGYEFKCVSGYLQCFDVSKLSKYYHSVYDAASMILWDTLDNIVGNPNPVVILSHILIETHYPYLNTELKDEIIDDMKYRFEWGKKDVDVQLEFYDKFLNDNAYRIYMSDHGCNQTSTRYHIHWNVYNKNLTPRKVKGLVSTLDLSRVIENIIEDKDIESEVVYRDYIEVQDLDRYSKYYIADMINKRTPLEMNLFGYRGVITKNHMYMKYRMGKEWLVERGNVKYEPDIMDFVNESDKISDIDLWEEMRSKVGGFSEDEEIKEKCKYSIYLYKLYDNYMRRIKENMNIICEAMKKYPKGSIALRMGGEHSYELFLRFQGEYKEKIGCIIDNNKECMCKKIGVPILSLEEAKHKEIKAILLSSYKYLNMLREEVKIYPKDMDIIDIYKELEKNGIYCKDNFYVDVQMRDEDYDVGFPFEDLE